MLRCSLRLLQYYIPEPSQIQNKFHSGMSGQIQTGVSHLAPVSLKLFDLSPQNILSQSTCKYFK